MSKLVTPIEAIVEYVTATKSGEFGDYRSILFKTPNEEKIWKSFSLDAEELTSLSIGTRVRLIPNGSTRSGKHSHVIELLADSPKPNVQRDKSEIISNLSDEQKREIASYVQEMANLYRYSYGEAARALRGMTHDPEAIRCATSALFISAQRKFNL